MVSLHYLKYTFNLNDEQTVERWVENPYWQFLSGAKFFSHELPIDPSSMTRWRKRIGEAGTEELQKETIQAGLLPGPQTLGPGPELVRLSWPTATTKQKSRPCSESVYRASTGGRKACPCASPVSEGPTA
jgi:hypothetical protein